MREYRHGVSCRRIIPRDRTWNDGHHRESRERDRNNEKQFLLEKAVDWMPKVLDLVVLAEQKSKFEETSRHCSILYPSLSSVVQSVP